MTETKLTLLSTIQSLLDEERPSVERELVALARSAALGELAADIAHDVANPLLGVLGLVDLLLDDATAGTEDEDRLLLVRQAALEMKATLAGLLDHARPPESGDSRADLGVAAAGALGLVRHGTGKLLEIEERFPAEPQLAACPEPLVTQAVLQLLLAARAGAAKLTVAVSAGTITITPGGLESLGTLVAARIAADHGGTLEHSEDAFTLRLPGR